ncbi:hypothetical protein CKA32_006048 [Geitlerinema sp. FC II]|nr:hypothetical protein CKA32_006048 [Geitlerinema sp. FC II]
MRKPNVSKALYPLVVELPARWGRIESHDAVFYRPDLDSPAFCGENASGQIYIAPEEGKRPT